LLAGTIDLQLHQISDRAGIVDIAHAGDGSGRLFLVEQQGRILIIENGTELALPFLDIRANVGSQANEQGLLSLAFAPDYSSSGYFYVWFTEPGGDTVLERYRVSQDPNRADSASGQTVLLVRQPFSNHNGGRLRFGPDGMLYLGLGDGGGGFDPQGNGQFGGTLLGKLIRIDVNPVHGSYAIPPDNPFANTDAVLDEVWALGLRNPWRISFDSLTGDLYIADVGQAQLEEVNFQPADSTGGENYGWVIMEGSQCVMPGCDQSGLTLPAAEYDHNTGCSITGGEVYRGQAYPNLSGMYLFSDFCVGNIWGMVREGNNWQVTELADTSHRISTFGSGEDGSVYVAGLQTGVFLLSDGPVVSEFAINAGLNDSWFNPATPGQGFFITVYPDTSRLFLAWFTYDTQRPPAEISAILGEPGHRWLTAFGTYSGGSAVLDIELTSGGIFDMAQPAPVQTGDGDILLEFDGCNSGTVTYDIDSIGQQGVIPIERIALDNVADCEAAK
jgi:glucose/arabinose dehydrogenase